ncbi:CoA transferase, partial [Streptococcus suis]
SVTGEPDREPQKVGLAVADVFTGLYSVIAIQAALAHAAKTGEGQLVDMALFDVQSAVMANQAMNYLATGNSPNRMGNVHPNI